MKYAIDDLGLLLSVVEIIFLLFGLVIYFWATNNIVRDSLLHTNFRFVMCIILFRSVLIPLRRLPTLYWRAFVVGEASVPFIVIYGELTMITSNLLCTCVLVLSMERLMNTHLKCCGRSGRIGQAVVLGALIVSNGSLFIIRRFWPNVIFSMAFLIFAPVVSFIVSALKTMNTEEKPMFSLLIWVFRTNSRRRNVLDATNLNEKAEANMNMNSVRIFLPAMFVSCLITLGLGLMSLAQFFWIKAEQVGSSESKLNNIYGLISAVDSLLTPLLVVVRHKLLKYTRSQRLHRQMQHLTMEEYFQQLDIEFKVIPRVAKPFTY